jgi:hypothetical protein
MYEDLHNTLSHRQKALAYKLDQRVGDYHPRLWNAKCLTQRDQNAAALTYREIVEREAFPPGIPGRPYAVRCNDEEVAVTLMEGHISSIYNYLITNSAPTKQPERLDDKPVFQYQEVDPHDDRIPAYPVAEGYDWYYGLLVPLMKERATAIIFVPWMMPWLPGRTAAPVIYTEGPADIDEVRAVAYAYSSYLSLPAEDPVIRISH